MKLLVLCNKMPYPGRDGSSIAILSMLRSMLHAGHEVHVFALNTTKHFVDESHIPQWWKEQITWHISPIDNTVEPLGAFFNLFQPESYMVSRFSNKATLSNLERVLRSNSFDLIQIEGIFMGKYIPIIRQESNALLALRAHNVETIIWNRLLQHQKNPLVNLYLKMQVKRLQKFESKVFESVDAILPITAEDADQIRNIVTKPMLVIPCGMEKLQHDAESTQLDFFQLAAMDWLPNVQGVEWFLKEVWPIIKSKIPEARVYFAGRNMPTHLFNLNSEWKGINIQGEVSDADQFYAEHGIQIVPLLSGSGMRIKLVEGMARGKAIVSTQIGCEGIGAMDGEEMLIAESAEDFAEKAIALYKNDELRKSIQKKARHLAHQKFDEKKIGIQMTDWFMELTTQG